jgi:hypothetical protein
MKSCKTDSEPSPPRRRSRVTGWTDPPLGVIREDELVILRLSQDVLFMFNALNH